MVFLSTDVFFLDGLTFCNGRPGTVFRPPRPSQTPGLSEEDRKFSFVLPSSCDGPFTGPG